MSKKIMISESELHDIIFEAVNNYMLNESEDEGLVKNLVTGKDIWGPWTPEKDVLQQVVSKDLLRYMPDRKVVDARNITHETKSYEEVVTYSPMKYSVIYNPNGVKGTPYSQNPYYDAKEKFEKNKFESTCTFVEWNTDEKGKGKYYARKDCNINRTCHCKRQSYFFRNDYVKGNNHKRCNKNAYHSTKASQNCSFRKNYFPKP